MIARTWRGATRAGDADAYLEYLHRTGFSNYRATPGNLAVFGLRRVRGGRAEFFLVTLWESAEAIRRFAGEEPERAVFYPEDDRFLIERDEHVDHYEVVYAHPPNPRGHMPSGGRPEGRGWLKRLRRWWGDHSNTGGWRAPRLRHWPIDGWEIAGFR